MNTLPLWVSIPASILLVSSGIVALTGSLGLLRFKNFYSRIHAPTMGNTLGTIGVLLASMLVSSSTARHLILDEILIVLLLVISSPVTAILLMQAAIRRDARRNPDNKESGPQR